MSSLFMTSQQLLEDASMIFRRIARYKQYVVQDSDLEVLQALIIRYAQAEARLEAHQRVLIARAPGDLDFETLSAEEIRERIGDDYQAIDDEDEQKLKRYYCPLNICRSAKGTPLDFSCRATEEGQGWEEFDKIDESLDACPYYEPTEPETIQPPSKTVYCDRENCANNPNDYEDSCFHCDELEWLDNHGYKEFSEVKIHPPCPKFKPIKTILKQYHCLQHICANRIGRIKEFNPPHTGCTEGPWLKAHGCMEFTDNGEYELCPRFQE